MHEFLAGQLRPEQAGAIDLTGARATIAGCATDIMLSNVQFGFKMLEPNKISLMFPGNGDQLLPMSDLISLTSRPGAGAR